MRLLSLVAVLGLAFPSVAQTLPVLDVGLTVDAGPFPVILGSQCGPVPCSPLQVGGAVRGQARTFLHASAPMTPFVLGIGLPGPCVSFQGIANGLLLDTATLQIVAVGLTSHEPTLATPGQQGLAVFVFPVPAGAPVGLTFRVQGLGQSNNGQIGFGPALELVVQ